MNSAKTLFLVAVCVAAAWAPLASSHFINSWKAMAIEMEYVNSAVQTVGDNIKNTIAHEELDVVREIVHIVDQYMNEAVINMANFQQKIHAQTLTAGDAISTRSNLIRLLFELQQQLADRLMNQERAELVLKHIHAGTDVVEERFFTILALVKVATL